MNRAEEAELATGHRYIELYNTDPELCVRECYHPDYGPGAMGISWFDGIDKFIEVEKAVLADPPQRRVRVDRAHATDDVVVGEAAVVDAARGADRELPFCAVLEIPDDRIAVDRTCADFNRWPDLGDGP